ncbi:MAG: hypothetical protein A2786_00935 [Candidatus Chisholmbacteria bacterium RIFCSPHIGHO2_01_FULL_52_32]|uniref:Glycosyltransferase 2-like domain-containing protein n=1 Tax=Candidatus Chisholmbacteria bacterium RIFCSPHIGHO2_01_FULL_52_32 TaxID=1797591 RepID=A0A1G1VUV5_9BACT|nr:MAG: hypothetical protein A2786_00935 [Candidatus Chisholmbacteria bacterium RIFCSPHIGHO2_01_FULL_52_32]
MLNLSYRVRFLLKHVLRGRVTKAEASRRLGVSRKTIYAWLHRYGPEIRRTPEESAAKRVSRSEPASNRLLPIIISHPEFGPDKISWALGEQRIQMSPRSVWLFLKHQGLQLRIEREAFASSYRIPAKVQPGLPAWLRLHASARKRMVEEVVLSKRKSGEVAREFHVSRKTLVKWKRRYLDAITRNERLLVALEDRNPSASQHPRGLRKEKERVVLDFVAAYPEYSAGKIAKRLGFVGNHGVQRVLERSGLSTIERRLAYSRQIRAARLPVYPLTAWLNYLRLAIVEFLVTGAPIGPPPFDFGSRLRRAAGRAFGDARQGFGGLVGGVRSLFSLLRRSLPFFVLSALVLSGSFAWGRFLGSATSPVQLLGWVFASIALSMGSVFFLYSLKYYITLAVVLSFSREAQDLTQGSRLSTQDSKQDFSRQSSVFSSKIGWLGRVFGIHNDPGSSMPDPGSSSSGGGLEPSQTGLTPDVSQVKLERYPFISVHLPLFNESKVVERLLKACTSFDYPNYEVVVADDSTDETTGIVERFLKGYQGEAREIKGDQGEEILHVTPSTPDTPSFTLIHRADREGFKGGALREALRVSDPRTEFVVVFDADFVPYPDTLELFLKYFQASAGSLDLKINTKDSRQNFSLQSSVFSSPIAAIQGYQWHVLNKSENWITRGIRSEYAGSYVVERSGNELYGGMKLIAGSVYMIRRDLLDRFGWGTTLTEDFELTLRLYEAGYKVLYTPYIQAPAECVSTLQRLVRQRMRWAEGHSFNIRKTFLRLLFGRWADVESSKFKVQSEKLQFKVQSFRQENNRTIEQYNNYPSQKQGMVWLPSPLSFSEKLEFLYLSPYYLQAAFFLIGTVSWLISEMVFRTRLPFWTQVWGWSLVVTNLLSLPLLNTVGLFLEEAEERDYLGIFSFVTLSYLLVPFQAYASVKGFLERSEGPWFRTPKTGRITDIFRRGRFYRFMSGILPSRWPAPLQSRISKGSLIGTIQPYLVLATANNRFQNFRIRPRHMRWAGDAAFSLVVLITSLLVIMAPFIPITATAQANSGEKFVSVQDAVEGKTPETKVEVIGTPRQIRVTQEDGRELEMIFHKEPRVRIKIGEREMEITTLEITGIGAVSPKKSLIIDDQEVRYEEIVEGVDLVYKIKPSGFIEQFIIRERLPIKGIMQKMALHEVRLIGTNGTYGVFDEENNEVFKLGEGVVYEKNNTSERNRDIKFEVEKDLTSYTFIKKLERGALEWTSAPNRIYPVVLDPSVIVSGNIVDADVDFGGQEQKLVYVSNAYYAFHNDGGRIAYRKCSSNCNNGGASWSSGSDVLMSDGGDTDNEGPVVTLDGTTIWVAWFDDTNTTGDDINFQSIDTASSDTPGTAVCSSADLGNVNLSDYVSINKGTNGDFVVSYSDDPDVLEVTGVTANCDGSVTFTDITTGSGITAADQLTATVDGNNIHFVWQEAGATGLRHNYRDVSGNTWGTEVAIDTANTSTSFGLVKTSDGDFYVHAVNGANTSTLYRCATPCTDAGRSWSSSSVFTGATNLIYATATYASSENDLILSVIKDTSEQAYFLRWDEATNSVESDVCQSVGGCPYGFSPGDLGHVASMRVVTNISEAGVVLRQGTGNFEFATVPEKSLILLVLAPFLPKALKGWRKEKNAH